VEAGGGPDDPESWNDRGNDLHDAGRLLEAQHCFERAVSLGRVDLALNVGNVLRHRAAAEPGSRHDLLSRAADSYRTAVGAGETAAWRNLGIVLEDLGLFEESERALRRAVSEGDVCAEVVLGSFYFSRGRLVEAEASYRAAVAAGCPESSIALGALLVAMAQYAEAEGLLQSALSIGTRDEDALVDLARVYRRTGRPALARDVLERAVADGSMVAMLPLANLLLDDFGDHEAAEALYRRAAALGDSHSAYNLALLLDQLGRYVEARHWYARSERSRLPDQSGDDRGAGRRRADARPGPRRGATGPRTRHR